MFAVCLLSVIESDPCCVLYHRLSETAAPIQDESGGCWAQVNTTGSQVICSSTSIASWKHPPARDGQRLCATKIQTDVSLLSTTIKSLDSNNLQLHLSFSPLRIRGGGGRLNSSFLSNCGKIRIKIREGNLISSLQSFNLIIDLQPNQISGCCKYPKWDWLGRRHKLGQV